MYIVDIFMLDVERRGYKYTSAWQLQL